MTQQHTYFAHRNDFGPNGNIVGNTYAVVDPTLAEKLKEQGERVFDEEWLAWHQNIAWMREYFSVVVEDCVLFTQQSYREFKLEGRYLE